jgi:hypothetical protein
MDLDASVARLVSGRPVNRGSFPVLIEVPQGSKVFISGGVAN